VTLNIYDCYKQYGFETSIPWEAYKLDNGLIVKISPQSDPRYPLAVGDEFNFISYNKYKDSFGLAIKDITEDVRSEYPERPHSILYPSSGGKPETTYTIYESKVVEKIAFPRILTLSDPDYDFGLLNFFFNGTPLLSEILVFMMQSIANNKLK